MGGVTVTSAKYVIGDQTIDVSEQVTDSQSRNYGEIVMIVSKLDADLRKNNQIAIPADSDTLKLTPPKLTVEYLDDRGLWHTKSATLSETLDIGERSAFGKFVQKPGDVLWGIGITAAKAQFLFIVVFVWVLVVLGTYRQWQFIEGAMQTSGIARKTTPYTDTNYGLVGQWVVWGISKLYDAFYYPSIWFSFGYNLPDGWPVKVLMSIGSAVAPISGFIVQIMIWFTAVVPIQQLKSPSPGSAATGDALSGAASLVGNAAAALGSRVPSGLGSLAAAALRR